jgi:hypothetical protein
MLLTGPAEIVCVGEAYQVQPASADEAVEI